MTKLGAYLDEMRKRHPRLSMRRMALDAGLSESVASKIIKDEMGARPETLKALADRWGTPEDYRELMRLAGYPVPEPVIDEDALLNALEPFLAVAGISSEDAQAAFKDEQEGKGVVEKLRSLARKIGQSLTHSPSEEVESVGLDPKITKAMQNEIVQDIALRASEMDEEVLKTLQEMVRHVAKLQGLDVDDEQGQD